MCYMIACLVVNSIKVNNVATLLNCSTVDLATNSMTAQRQIFSRRQRLMIVSARLWLGLWVYKRFCFVL